jgi:stalled ribosome rescue protein Dom34
MTTLHAVLRIDHESAKVFQFDAEHVEAQKIKAHTHHTRQHGSGVRTQHEFFGDVATALEGISEVLVAGHGTGPGDFEAYCRKHRPQLAKHLVGTELIDQPTDAQLVALARKYFLKYDRMQGTPTPT